jgi:hypothetical protein
VQNRLKIKEEEGIKAFQGRDIRKELVLMDTLVISADWGRTTWGTKIKSHVSCYAIFKTFEHANK